MPADTEPPSRYLSILFDRSVIHAIDEFRFGWRVESRTEAIRMLIEYALKHPKQAANGK